MKKIIIVMVFVLPLFFLNNVQAQNGSQGGSPPPYFSVKVYVSAPSNCPTTGNIEGYIPILGHAYTNYTGPTYYGNPYVLVWSRIFQALNLVL